jgi:hypothetical protein
MKKINLIMRLASNTKVIWPEFTYYTRGRGMKTVRVDLNVKR